jgi:hypothetical protein
MKPEILKTKAPWKEGLIIKFLHPLLPPFLPKEQQ